MVDEASVSVDALRHLVDSVMPRLGVLRGCLFLSEEGELSLTPVLRIGKVPLALYNQFLITNSVTTVN